MRPLPSAARRSSMAFVSVVVAVAGILAACGPSPTPPPAPSAQTGPPSAAATPGSAGSVGSAGPSASAAIEGFAFDAESILGYYATRDYTCGEAQPSTQAAGYTYRSCQSVDGQGRTRVVGIVTDPNDDVADAFASVAGADGETILDPSVALEPLAAFLGATLGESPGEALLPWLAGHLGDQYATTSVANLTVATYSESADDHSRLYVEIADPSYLAAPMPRPSTPPSF